MAPIRKVLIANRGEIALRVIRTCRDLGVRTVAVYSEADRNSLFVQQADQAVFIGPAPALQSYLVIDNILKAAKASGADAIHPGYGFLSENEEFARACTKAGVTFIGPLPETMGMLGNKLAVKQLLEQKEPNVPLIPGYNGSEQDYPTLLREAKRCGFPVLLKAVAGGGGKGMRVVRRAEDMESALDSVQSEARNSFGNADVLIEKYFDSVRHIEIQIFGDHHGGVVSLGERDCSTQRRHQKVIEETPSLHVSPGLRARMGKAAVTIGKLANYRGAGTVEFLVDPQGEFYFLEVNTRLQVEHPITELAQELDLVKLQIQAAEGASLKELGLLAEDRKYAALNPDGGLDAPPTKAIEVRIYAEDPCNNFFPCTGQITYFKAAQGIGVRHDGGVATGSEVSVHYDPMVAKVIASGDTRDEAIRRLITALQDTVVLGLTTNQAFLLQLLQDPLFRAGDVDTGFIDKHITNDVRMKNSLVPEAAVDEMAVVCTLWDWAQRNARRGGSLRRLPSGWTNAGKREQTTAFKFAQPGASKSSPLVVRYRNLSTRRAQGTAPRGIGNFELRVEREEESDDTPPRWSAPIHGTIISHEGNQLTCEVNGVRSVYHVSDSTALPQLGGPAAKSVASHRAHSMLEQSEEAMWIHAAHLGAHSLTKQSRFMSKGGAAGGSGKASITAPMPCKILKVLVEEGEAVSDGQLVLVVESMKMEMKIFAECAGAAKIFVKAGDVLKEGVQMVLLQPSEE